MADIEGKMNAFRQEYNALTYVLIYKLSAEDGITFGYR